MGKLRVRREGRHLVLTLADAGRQNALSAEMVAEFEAALDALPEGLGALVIEGVGGVFSAGADLKALYAALAQPPGESDPLEALNAAGGKFFARVHALPCVTVALVDGAAVGGGMGLAAAADIVIATPRARFALTETSLGLPPAQIAPYLVARLGARVATRLALTGARLDGRDAAALGLADLYSESDGADRLAEVLGAVGRCAPGANVVTKRLLRAVAAPDYIAEAAQAFAAALRGAEGREGLAAFAEKRAPRWPGAEL
jgi:isohexenylglutaconyl-CoA hydratase